jgi:hypothetical protein
MAPDPGFHLYLLIGQSNMAGRGEVEAEDRLPHTRVLALGRELRWIPAIEPLHWDKPMAGVGPGRAFGCAMVETEPTIRVGLIPAAAGGSPIEVWQPGGYWEQTASHPYDDAVERARRAMQDGALKGVLWHQGESDAQPERAPLYEQRLSDLVARLRHDLALPDLPFVAGTLGDFLLGDRPHAATINAVLRTLPRRTARTACADAAGLTDKGDGLHFDSSSARELGRRYAQALRGLLAQAS